jgi:drug/metabolite transporter (DMT)-like permease
MVVIPFVTVLLSAWLDAEPIRAGLAFGGLLILTGVYIGALRPAPGAPARPPAAPPLTPAEEVGCGPAA